MQINAEGTGTAHQGSGARWVPTSRIWFATWDSIALQESRRTCLLPLSPDALGIAPPRTCDGAKGLLRVRCMRGGRLLGGVVLFGLRKLSNVYVNCERHCRLRRVWSSGVLDRFLLQSTSDFLPLHRGRNHGPDDRANLLANGLGMGDSLDP
eukprot:scaffold7403_cov277-Pinguiococcus_pyrenoidosus.AAC.5